METSRSKSSTSDFGEYWTNQTKRLGVLAALIIIGIATIVHAVQFPDTNYVNSSTVNYTKQQGSMIQDINETTTLTKSS